MAVGRIHTTGPFQDGLGSRVPNQRYYVCAAGTTTLATVYSDSAGTIQASQPLLGTAQGLPGAYYAAEGSYDLLTGGTVSAGVLTGGTVVDTIDVSVASTVKQSVLAVRSVTAAGSINTTDTVVLADATGFINPPSNIAVAQVVGGGSFAAGTYYYTVTAVDGSGHESIAKNTNAVVTVNLNDRATVTWTNPAGTVQNKIYRCAFNYPTPTANTPNLVTTISANTTYTDTGSATSGTAPPASNGGAFTLTLPDATTFGAGPLIVRAIGDTPNLVTLAAFGSQKIDTTLANVTLGKVGGADYRAVTLLPSGSGWKIVDSVPPPIKHLYAGNPYGVTAPSGLGTQTPAVVVGPVSVGFGQKAKVNGSVQLVPGTGVTEVILTIDWCDSSGNVVDNVLAGGFIPIHSNMAFFYAQNLGVGEPLDQAFSWFYDPRPGDVQREGYTGNYTYLRLAVISIGGSTVASAAGLDVAVGAVQSAYWPAP